MATPVLPAVVVRYFPHDPNAFTQGLALAPPTAPPTAPPPTSTPAGPVTVYESTGLYGRSSLRACDLATGTVQRTLPLPPTQFGEGLAFVGDHLYQLTWRERLLHRTSLTDWERQDAATIRHTIPYPPSWPTEGWGIAYDQHQLLLSDGSATLYFAAAVAPYPVTRHVLVTAEGRPVRGLNALAVVRGYVYANVFPTSRIAIIVPQTGRVVAWLELAHLYPFPVAETWQTGHVANGIAYDPATARLLVTGKCWPVLYELAVPTW